MQLDWCNFRDKDFNQKQWHIHHIEPLFLGGEDNLNTNAKLLQPSPHMKGNARLRIQPQMQTSPPPLPPLHEDLLQHPVGTLYILAGFKM